MCSDIKIIPEPSLRRLPIYYHFLKNLLESGKNEVSTTFIANELKVDPTQVRKDIAYTGIIGKPKVGYKADEVIEAIEKYLNWNNTTDAFLVGTGNLGLSMLAYDRFSEYGIKILAAFDNDPLKVNTQFKDTQIFHIDKMVNLMNRMHIHIGIITVPRTAAQEVADLLIEGGAKAIWNFAPVTLKTPEGIIVENAPFSNSLGVLTRKLSEILNK